MMSLQEGKKLYDKGESLGFNIAVLAACMQDVAPTEVRIQEFKAIIYDDPSYLVKANLLIKGVLHE